MIKEATIYDIFNIADMWEAMMKETGLVKDGESLNKEQFIMQTIVNLKNPEYRIFISYEGFISGYLTQPDYIKKISGICDHLFVKPDFRGADTTDRLISKLLTYFSDNHVTDIQFITVYDEKLIRFWKIKGYKPEKIIFGKEA